MQTKNKVLFLNIILMQISWEQAGGTTTVQLCKGMNERKVFELPEINF